MNVACILLALLSVWDYQARYPEHDRLCRQFRVAVREGDTATMEETCRKGVKLLPEDPTWRFNLACSLAYFAKRENEAFDELEKAIDLGFRDRTRIESDTDLKRLAKSPRYEQLLVYADLMKERPILSGPLAAVDATGVFGKPVVLGEQNLGWDFDTGSFVANLKLAVGTSEPSVGDLYMNRDSRHSTLNLNDFPGITSVRLDIPTRTDATGQKTRVCDADLDFPNMLFPYPVFGNCSRASVSTPQSPNPYWRSLPRAMMTTKSESLGRMVKFYLSNQIWVFPSNADTAPVGTNGDVFASIAPYWLTTAGKSYSDQPYLRAALEASRSFDPQVKAEIVKRGLLAPTIQTLIRKSLKGVTNEVEYLTAKAHPTAMPPNGLDLARLAAAAKAMTVETIPPLAAVSVAPAPVRQKTIVPELTYASAFAWAFVLRADEQVRQFTIVARGAETFSAAVTHGDDGGEHVRVTAVKPNVFVVAVDKSVLSPTNRVDITVVGRNAKTGWGAPSYVSFARMDPSAPYSDPALTVLPQPQQPKK